MNFLFALLIYIALGWVPVVIVFAFKRDWYPALTAWARIAFQAFVYASFAIVPLLVIAPKDLGLVFPDLLQLFILPLLGIVVAFILLLIVNKLLPNLGGGQRSGKMTNTQHTVWIVYHFIFPVLGEEIMFRGFLFLYIRQFIGTPLAFLVQCVLFTIDHLPRDFYARTKEEIFSLDFVNLVMQHVIFGIIAGLIALITDSILPTIVFHEFCMIAVFLLGRKRKPSELIRSTSQ